MKGDDTFFSRSIKPFATALLLSIVPVIAAAESPDRKNPVAGEEVVQMYLGKTWTWSKGGSYWGSGGAFEAIWKDAVGIGKWYATSNGKLCYEATWTGPNGTSEYSRCWLHVTDSEGRLWKQDMEDGEWYRPNKEFSERIKPGNGIGREVKKRRRSLGV